MRAGIVVSATPQHRIRLEAIVADRHRRQKHAARARVIVGTDDGCGTTEIMRRSGLAKPVVWRWQERLMREGVLGQSRTFTAEDKLRILDEVDRAGSGGDVAIFRRKGLTWSCCSSVGAPVRLHRR